MKVTCVGTDPAALYLGILLKRKDPAHVVRFVETAGPGLPLPPAIVSNPLKPRLQLRDAETLEALKPLLTSTDTVAVSTDERSFTTAGLRYSFADPAAITEALRGIAKRLGCTFEARAVTDDDRRADVLVAADGPNSAVRTAAAGFEPAFGRSSNVTVMFQSSEPTDCLLYTSDAADE